MEPIPDLILEIAQNFPWSLEMAGCDYTCVVTQTISKQSSHNTTNTIATTTTAAAEVAIAQRETEYHNDFRYRSIYSCNMNNTIATKTTKNAR